MRSCQGVVTMNQCVIRSPGPGDWPRIAELLAESIPNALASHFGQNFGSIYYRHLAESPGACSFAAFDGAGTLAGVVIGTLDRQHSRQLPLVLKLRLLLAAHYRLLSPASLSWLANRRRTVSRPEGCGSARPRA